MKNFDLIVIGFGKGGKTLALKAANIGKKVALVEKDSNMYGGTCINVGCIPTKKLFALSKQAKFYSDKDNYFAQSMQQKNKLISALRQKNFDMLNSHENITIFNNTAKLIDQNTISLDDNDQITAKNIVINTGSTSVKADFQIDSDMAYYSDDILNLNKLPSHLVIVGGSFIAIEFASMMASFGCKITLISRSNLLKNEDETSRESILAMLKEQDINIIQNAKISSIKDDKIYFNDDNLQADAFLLALGRQANTKNLNLQNVGIKINANNSIKVNENLQTTIDNIYAIGDVRGGDMFTYISLDDYRIVWQHLYGNKCRNLNNQSPYAKVIFTKTPYAKIGINLNEAKEKNINAKELKILLSNVPNAKILGNDYGFLRAFVQTDSGEILGASFHCEEAHEIINIIAVAMKFKATANDLSNQIFTHPSISEALNDLFSQYT
ncbi:dihydrolipoyl dehydrogenase family protein [Campylobacter majalis]|uniref:dihydrolipoyl dehydrogenase family protein n=1 Tax=Campylobacter majalis TaxID=2790656 RepID=UPI003D69AD20